MANAKITQIITGTAIAEIVDNITIVSEVEQGPIGVQGEKGESGNGIDNFEGDPLLAYLMARG